MKPLNIEYVTEEWKLFKNSSKFRLKVLLFFNSNTVLSIPLRIWMKHMTVWNYVWILSNTKNINSRSMLIENCNFISEHAIRLHKILLLFICMEQSCLDVSSLNKIITKQKTRPWTKMLYTLYRLWQKQK